jgi:hypothetical protein
LQRKDTLIDVNADLDGTVSLSPESQLSNITVESIQDMLKEANTPMILQRAFFTSEIVRSELLHWSYYRDLLYDVNHLFSSKISQDSAVQSTAIDDISHLLHMKIKRKLWTNETPVPTKSVRIHLKTNAIAPSCYPPNGHSVVLETTAEQTFTFIAENRFAYWDFIKSLRRLYFMGISRHNKCGAVSPLHRLHYISEDGGDEGWQNSVNFSGKMKVIVRNKSQKCLCRLQPSLMKLVVLNIDTNIEVFHIPLDTLKYMHLGLEFEEYKPYDLKLNITSGKLPRNVLDLSGHTDDESSSSSSPSTDSSGKWYPGKKVGKLLKSTRSVVLNSVQDASNSVNSVANSVMSTLAPKTIRTKIVVNFPNTCEFETHLLEGRGPYWDEDCHHRLQLSDLSSIAEQECKSSSSGSGSGSTSSSDDLAVGMHMHLLTEGADKSQVVLGSKFVRYAELIPRSAAEEFSESSFSNQGGKPTEESSQSFLLDSTMSLHIRVVRGEGLLPPERSVMSVENVLATTADSLLTGVDVVTNAIVLSHGKTVGKSESFKISKELLTDRKPAVVVSFARSDRTLREDYAAYRYVPHIVVLGSCIIVFFLIFLMNESN